MANKTIKREGTTGKRISLFGLGSYGITAGIITLLVFVLDRITKLVLENTLQPQKSQQIIEGILSFTLVHNYGAGFGLLQNERIFFLVFSLAVLVFIFIKWDLVRKEVKSPVILGLFIGGLLSNFYDRLFKGYVVDFIDFHIWPVFNIADTTITLSAIILAIIMLRKK